MDFWKILKYVLMGVFAAILFAGYVLSQDQGETVQQPVPQTGSKFNF